MLVFIVFLATFPLVSIQFILHILLPQGFIGRAYVLLLLLCLVFLGFSVAYRLIPPPLCMVPIPGTCLHSELLAILFLYSNIKTHTQDEPHWIAILCLQTSSSCSNKDDSLAILYPEDLVQMSTYVRASRNIYWLNGTKIHLDFQKVLQNTLPILHSFHWCMRVLIFPHACQHLLLLVPFVRAI